MTKTAQETLEAMRSGNFKRNLSADAFEDVVSILEQAKDSVDRRHCYTMLGDLALQTRSPEIGTFAVKRLATEKTLEMKTAALRVIGWTSGVKKYDAVIEAVENKRLAWNAIQALGACVGKRAETALVNVLKSTKVRKDTGNAIVAAVALARMAGSATVKQLSGVYKQLPNEKWMGSTRAYLIFAVSRYPTKASTEFVRKELDATKIWQLGWACLNYLYKHGDAKDVERTSEYLTALLGRYKRNVEVLNYAISDIDHDFQSELAACIAILSRDGQEELNSFIPKIFDYWECMSFEDQTQLKTITATLFDGMELSSAAGARTAVL